MEQELDNIDIDENQKIDLQTHLNDFFDYIIWESISMILVEVPGDTNNEDIKKFRNKIKQLFLNALISVESPSDFKKKMKILCKETSFINLPMSGYIIETISIFRLRLYSIFSKKELSGHITDELKKNIEILRKSIEENIIISYMDKYIISNNLIRILLFSSKVSFAEVNEFRIHLIEVFKDILEGKTSLKEVKEFLGTELNNLALNSIVREYISSMIFGSLTSIIRTTDYSSTISQMKNSIYNKIVYKTVLTFIKNDKINNIVNWLSEEGINPFLDIIKTYSMKIEPPIFEIQQNIKEIYKKQLERKITAGIAIERLLAYKKIIKIEYTSNKMKNNTIKVDKNIYTKNKFIKHNIKIQGYSNIVEEEETNFKPENTIDLFFNSLTFLSNILDDELIVDFKLDRLHKMIKERNFGLEQLYL